MISSSLKIALTLSQQTTLLPLCCSRLGKFASMSSSSSDVKELKHQLRLKMKDKLKNLSQAEKIKQTYINSIQLIKHPGFQKTERIAIYVNMKNEVGTYDILKEAFSLKKQVYIPLVKGDTMKMVKLNSVDELKSMPKSKWGIIQPLESDNREDCLETGGVQFVVVPGVAFTTNNLRLGHGKGYYDKFLAKNDQISRSQCVTIGVAFNEQMVEDLPTNENDYRLTGVVYPDMSTLYSEYNEPLASPPDPFTI